MADKKKTHDVFETALDNPDDYEAASEQESYDQRREHDRQYEHDMKFQRDPNLKVKQLKVRSSPEGTRRHDDAVVGALGGAAAFIGQRLLRRKIRSLRGLPEKNYNEIGFVTGPSTAATAAFYNYASGVERRRAEHRKKNKSRQEK